MLKKWESSDLISEYFWLSLSFSFPPLCICFFNTFSFKKNMDIYGIKKNIQVIEQVFLDMTNVPSVVMVE